MAAAEERGAHFQVYGKAPARLVPSGRVLEHRQSLELLGARLLMEPDYCATSWETASNWLRVDQDFPDCSEVVIDESGRVHPCCWYRISPALFDLTQVPFEAGIARAAETEAYRLLDRGDVVQVGVLAGLTPDAARAVRDSVGECGACRLFFARLAALEQPGLSEAVRPLSASERRHYAGLLGGDEFASFRATLGLV